MDGWIKLADALKKMEEFENDSPKPFSVRYVTYDEKRKKGGEIVMLENVVLNWNKDKKKPSVNTGSSAARKPSHHSHATRNFCILSSGQIRKAHIHLIIEFNGLKVMK